MSDVVVREYRGVLEGVEEARTRYGGRFLKLRIGGETFSYFARELLEETRRALEKYMGEEIGVLYTLRDGYKNVVAFPLGMRKASELAEREKTEDTDVGLVDLYKVCLAEAYGVWRDFMRSLKEEVEWDSLSVDMFFDKIGQTATTFFLEEMRRRRYPKPRLQPRTEEEKKAVEKATAGLAERDG